MFKVICHMGSVVYEGDDMKEAIDWYLFLEHATFFVDGKIERTK